MTVKTKYFRGDIYKNDKNSELQCLPSPIAKEEEQQENSICPLRVGKLRDWPPGAAFNKNLHQEGVAKIFFFA